MDAQLEAKLIECLDALAQGESTERILARYPQEAALLRPLLATAAGLPALRMEPSEAAKMQSRQKFMAQADLLRRTTPRQTLGFLPRFAAGFIAAALVAGVLGTGAVATSGSALPGDPLYSLKRAVEDVRLNTASSPTQRQELQREFEQRRRSETDGLLNAGREGEVEFAGTIEVIQPNAWIVSGLVVQLDANTQIAGIPQVNRVAEVRGVTGPKGLRATSISIESSGEPEMTPPPEVKEIPRATETPQLTETTAPATTTTPQPPTAAPRPTATAQPADTPQPVEVEFTGNVNAIEAGTWNIDGTVVIVDDSTEIRDTISTGQRVKVKALRLADGRLIATRIEPTDDGIENDNSNSNDNQNSNENHNDNGGNSNDDNGNSNSNDNGGNSNGNGNDDEGGNDNGN